MLADVRRPTSPAAGLAGGTRQGGLSRRALLAGSAIVGATLVTGAACTSGPEPEPAPTSSPPADQDAALRTAVGAQEADLIALYDATMQAHPGLAASLAAIRDEHAAHAESMASVAPSTQPAPIAATRGEALAALIAAEQQAIALRATACEEALDPELARLTALIAASEAGHAEFLRSIT